MDTKISPFLWFDKDLKEIIAYYQNIFNKDGKINFEEISHHILSSDSENKVEMATVKIFNNIYHFMGAKRYVDFNESFSLMIITEDQTETDYYWDMFTQEGSENVCGWCRDKYGLSWQITPKKLLELNTSSDKETVIYAMEQMQKMKKIIIKDLER